MKILRIEIQNFANVIILANSVQQENVTVSIFVLMLNPNETKINRINRKSGRKQKC